MRLQSISLTAVQPEQGALTSNAIQQCQWQLCIDELYVLTESAQL